MAYHKGRPYVPFYFKLILMTLPTLPRSELSFGLFADDTSIFYTNFQLTFSTIKFFHVSLTATHYREDSSSFSTHFSLKRSAKLHFRDLDQAKQNGSKCTTHNSPVNAYDPKICIALSFSNEPSDGEWIKITTPWLVHQLRGNHPDGFIKCNPNEPLGLGQKSRSHS